MTREELRKKHPRVAPRTWPPEDVAKLRTVFRETDGNVNACLAAFPDRTLPSVRGALRRFTGFEPELPPAPISAEEVRARLAALPLDTFIEGLSALAQRNAGFMGCDP